MATILVADDERTCRESIQKVLEREGHLVESAEDVDSALHKLDERQFDLVVCDFRMPRKTGADLILELRERGQSVPVIVISAFADDATERNVLAMGAKEVLRKPIRRRDLVDGAVRALGDTER
jgi:DNA-binding NtrC family response regulator